MFTKLKKKLEGLKSQPKGFTIIEVLIVLAIAGLILLIIFLAVPALQRNSRNTQRKNDAAGVLGIINEYANNNGGTLPAVVCQAGNTVTVGGGSCATPTSPATVQVSGQFTAASTNIAPLPATIPTAATANTLQFYSAASCNGNALATGSGRSVVAWYQVEPAVNQCNQS